MVVLFRNFRFMLNEMTWQNTSKAILLEHNLNHVFFSFVFHFVPFLLSHFIKYIPLILEECGVKGFRKLQNLSQVQAEIVKAYTSQTRQIQYMQYSRPSANVIVIFFRMSRQPKLTLQKSLSKIFFVTEMFCNVIRFIL